MTTAKQLVERAGRLIGVGEMWGKQQDNVLFALNQMLNDWSSTRNNIYQTVRESVTLTYNDNEYTIGSGGDFDTAWPIRIIAAYILRSNVSYPVVVNMSDEQYAAITDKTTKLRPTHLLYEPSYPLGRIILTPVPNQADTLYLYSHKPIDQFASLAATSTLPPPYETAVVYNLAIDIAAEFERDPRPVVYARADETKKALQRANRTVTVLNTDVIATQTSISLDELFESTESGVFPYVFPFTFTS